MNTRLILAGLLFATATARAQLPVLFYDFSNTTPTTVPNLGTDITSGVLFGAAVIASGGPENGFSGGPGGSILTLDGGSGSFVDSGISAALLGFTTDNYTSSAWVRLNSYGGDSMVFGQQANTGSDTYLHNGVRNDNPHMGHWGNDTTGSTNLNSTFGTGNWFHMTFRYFGDEQSIYINGNLVAREMRGNLPSTSNVLIGSSNNDGGLPGALDDVVVYNSTLSANQIAFLANGGNPKALPAPAVTDLGYLGARGSISPLTQPQGPDFAGGSGKWAVREVASSEGARPDNLFQAVDVLKNPPAGSNVVETYTSVVNRRDPEAGASHLFVGDTPFLTNSPGDDDRRAFLYRAHLKVYTEGDYTFGYHGDDGFALRIGNFQWSSNTLGDGNRGSLDIDDPRTLIFPYGTGDANMRGTIHLTPGEHEIELVSWEGVGGGSHELYWAHGTFAQDAQATWRLLGGNHLDPVANIPSVTAAGWKVKTSAPGGTPLNNINDARADLDATGTEITDVANINYTDPELQGTTGSVQGDVPFPRDTVGVDDEDYAILATATLKIDVAETYAFHFRSDDGAWLRIVGQTGWTVTQSAVGGNVTDRFNLGIFDAIQADVLTGDSGTTGEIFLLPGEYQIEAGFFERGGGSSFEILAGDADSGTLQLLAAGSNQALDGTVGQLQIVPEPTSVAMLLGGFGALLGFQRLRRRH
jgi:hypothetical protein